MRLTATRLMFGKSTKNGKAEELEWPTFSWKLAPRAEERRSPDYVVEDHADHILATTKTQQEAIDWAKNHGHTPHVARVRQLNDKKKPDHWRAV